MKSNEIADRIEFASKEFIKWKTENIAKNGKTEYRKQIKQAKKLQEKQGFQSDIIIKIFGLDEARKEYTYNRTLARESNCKADSGQS